MRLGSPELHKDVFKSLVKAFVRGRQAKARHTNVRMDANSVRRQDCALVVIGRNEGERLKKCLRAASSAAFAVYVDSGSTDDSVQWTRKQGIHVLELDLHIPFTAARARNAGFKRCLELAPGVPFVQFVDGDCELAETWIEQAAAFLATRPDIGMVVGRLRERGPERSVYNWLCDREWEGPSGEIRYSGGIAMVRTTALEAVHGYRDKLIAGEEPELCARLRDKGWRIWRLDEEMALHDANITRFGQWWRRAVRGGYAYALGASLHGAPPEALWIWESRRAWIWGFALPLLCVTASIVFPWGLLSWLVYPLEIARKTVNNPGPLRDRATLAFFHVLARIPEAWGQLKFMRDRLFGRQAHLIEYK